MDPQQIKPPLVVIVGPTASGKSALGLEIARKFNGEIICADSRTVYKDMDIGTAKPSAAEQAEIPHYMLDVVDPDKTFTAAEFKRRALIWIDDISIRGKLPIIVGGTGLYIDGVIFDYAFLPPVPQEEREQLQALTIEELQQKLADQDIPLPENSRNPRHLIRALETNGVVPVKKGLRENTLVIGLSVDKPVLEERINKRVNEMVDKGFADEVKQLISKYGAEAPGLQAPGYKAFRQYLEGTATLAQAKQLFVRFDMQLAKRQRTWFKRNQSIKWIKNSSEAAELVKYFLHHNR